jgi:aminopeptidase N
MRYCIRNSLFLFAMIANSVYSQNKSIDVQHYSFEIALDDSNNIIHGKASIDFVAKQSSSSVYFDLIGPNDSNSNGMKVFKVLEDNRDLKFLQKDDRINIYFNNQLPLNALKKIEISYEGIPADGIIIDTNKFASRTFFADNWPNRAHNWIPCNDHPSDKASVEFIVTAPDHYQVIANGILVEESNLPGNLKLTHWKEDSVLPTKVMVIGMADFAVQLASVTNGVPIWSWVFS